MKKIIIFISLLLALALGGLGGYRYWKSSPSHAISQIRASVQNRDPALFREYVDLETVLDRGADNLLAGKGKQNWAGEIARGIALSLKPKLVAELKSGIESWMQTGQVPAEKKNPAAIAANAAIGHLSQLLFLDIVNTQETNRARIVTVRLRHQGYGCELVPELLLLKTGAGHLQLAEITNLSELLAQLLIGEMAWKESQNVAARKKIESVLQITGLHKTNDESMLGLRRKIVFRADARNASDKTITRIKAILTATTLNAPPVTKKWPVTFESAIPPGKTETLLWEMTVNPFHADEVALFKSGPDSLSFTFEVESVTRAGGQRLEIPYPE